jgi:hypothetical protein
VVGSKKRGRLVGLDFQKFGVYHFCPALLTIPKRKLTLDTLATIVREVQFKAKI